jgi:hypothetical protein
MVAELEHNKAVDRRFPDEASDGGDLSGHDEVLAPDAINHAARPGLQVSEKPGALADAGRELGQAAGIYGPRTRGLGGDGRPGSLAGELRQEVLALTGAKAADAAAGHDAGALHDCGGAGRPDTRQRAEDLRDLRSPG